MLSGSFDEAKSKHNMRIGGADERAGHGDAERPQPWTPNDLGILIASCEKGDLRQSPFGIYVHDDSGTRDVPLTGNADPKAGRIAELEELYDAVVLGKPVRHSGAWGTATLDACLAIVQSSRERREIRVSHQVPAPDDD